MIETYTTYDAKSRLSEILRKVESGQIIRISRRGQPIAELRPIRREPASLAERIIELTDQGVVVPASGRGGDLRPLVHHPGALDRFLADRNG